MGQLHNEALKTNADGHGAVAAYLAHTSVPGSNLRNRL